MSEPVRVLLVTGSTRAGSGNTAALATVAAVAPRRVTAVMYDGLARLPAFNPDDDGDRVPREVAELRDEIAAADAILFCTPEYAGALPGSFKNLLDWTIGDEHPGSIYRKPVAWINVSASSTGAADAHESLGKVLGYAHADVIAAACVRVPVSRPAIDGDGLIRDPAIRGDALNALNLLSTAAAQRDRGQQA